MTKKALLAMTVLTALTASAINYPRSEEQKSAMQTLLTAYLDSNFPCQVTSVAVTGDEVFINGNTTGNGTWALAEITPVDDVTEPHSFARITPINGHTFTVTMPRHTWCDGYEYDRVLSRWAIIDVSVNGAHTLASHARYADTVTPISSPQELLPASKKGVGAGLGQTYMEDIVTLNAHSITINVIINQMIALSPIWKNNIEYRYGGRSYYIDGDEIVSWDRHLNFYQAHNVVVSAIILITPTSTDPALNSVFCHPENNGGFYTMPNMTTMAGVNAYSAIINYLASRYNGSGHGRIHHWIMHNEVDMATMWTNMGSLPELTYLDAYMKSMRLCHNIVRQYDQHAAILASFTHNWTVTTDGDYPSRSMMEHIVQYSKAEGDFWWGLACHPYPQDINLPDFWIDDTQSTYSQNTGYVTFKNLEVINDWIQMPDHLYKGTVKRKLFLSENGTNSLSYSEKDLARQAAGGAWAWKKANALPGIDAIMWHNWMDNREEFGLRIGLHYYPDDEMNPGGNKPVWHVWKAAGTEQEDMVFDTYKEILGISNWNDIFLTKP